MKAVPSSTPGIAQGSQIASDKADLPEKSLRAMNQASPR